MTDLPLLPPRALSVRQPWAWAIIHAGKDIENRGHVAITRGGMRPGQIAIHASKGMTRDEYAEAYYFMHSIGVTCPAPGALIRGGIIGSVRVTAIVSNSMSKWWFGPRGLVLTEAFACEPRPAVGALGYFDWKESGELEQPLPWMRPKSDALPPADLFKPLTDTQRPDPALDQQLAAVDVAMQERK